MLPPFTPFTPSRSVWVPPGQWQDAWDGSIVTGPKVVMVMVMVVVIVMAVVMLMLVVMVMAVVIVMLGMMAIVKQTDNIQHSHGRP